MLSMSRMLPTTEQRPQMTPQKSVTFHESPHQSSRRNITSSTAVKKTPTAKTNAPRDRSLRAKSLKTKSLKAAKTRQQKASRIAMLRKLR